MLSHKEGDKEGEETPRPSGIFPPSLVFDQIVSSSVFHEERKLPQRNPSARDLQVVPPNLSMSFFTLSLRKESDRRFIYGVTWNDSISPRKEEWNNKVIIESRPSKGNQTRIGRSTFLCTSGTERREVYFGGKCVEYSDPSCEDERKSEERWLRVSLCVKRPSYSQEGRFTEEVLRWCSEFTHTRSRRVGVSLGRAPLVIRYLCVDRRSFQTGEKCSRSKNCSSST